MWLHLVHIWTPCTWHWDHHLATGFTLGQSPPCLQTTLDIPGGPLKVLRCSICKCPMAHLWSTLLMSPAWWWSLHHLSGREGIRCSLPMAWSIVKKKETSHGAICFWFKDVDHKIHLLYGIVGCEIAITILASSKEHMGFTKNHLTVFYWKVGCDALIDIFQMTPFGGEKIQDHQWHSFSLSFRSWSISCVLPQCLAAIIFVESALIMCDKNQLKLSVLWDTKSVWWF